MWKGIFVGYVPKAYKIFNPETNSFVVARDVIFDEISYLSTRPEINLPSSETNKNNTRSDGLIPDKNNLRSDGLIPDKNNLRSDGLIPDRNNATSDVFILDDSESNRSSENAKWN